MPLSSTVALTPTTAPSLSSVTVVAGLCRSTCPASMACSTAGGSVSASTLSPTDSAVTGSTAACTTAFIWSVSVQNFSSPNVLNRKIAFPSTTSAGDGARGAVLLSHAAAPAMTTPASSAASGKRPRPWLWITGTMDIGTLTYVKGFLDICWRPHTSQSRCGHGLEGRGDPRQACGEVVNRPASHRRQRR